MDFLDVVRKRRMVRNYEEGLPVPADQIDRIVETARRAPSAGFTQGQSFVVVTDKATRSELADLLNEPSYRERGLEPWISRAPVHVVICTSPEAYRERYGEPDKAGTAGAAGRWPVPWWIWDAGAAFMLLLLAAVDEGLAAGFLAFDPNARQPVRKLLSIPERVLPVGVVTIGRPAEDRRSGSLKKGWKPKSEVIHRDRWNPSLG